MEAAAEPLVILPLAGMPHSHTGCFHVECPLPGGLALWLFGGYRPPRLEAGCPQFRIGQVLGGYVRLAGVESEEPQATLERSGVLAGLAVEWVELPFPGMRRWFQFRVGPELVGELVERLRAFASRAAE